MEVVLTRTDSRKDCTLGNLKIMGVGHPTIYTLEEPWQENKQTISCIPKGTYKCVPHNWKSSKAFRFGKVWEVTKVPNRLSILIHAGNTTDDIEGCILVGLSRGDLNGLEAVLESRKAIDMLRSIIGEAGFNLTIK